MTNEKRFKKVYLEIGNVCNLNCSFCPGTNRKPQQMTVEEFSLAAGKLRAYTDYLYFHLMGEPLLHPQLENFLETAGDMTYKVIITTNGVLLEKRGDALLESSAVHKVNISLQSFEANEGGRLEEYISTCAAFAAKASERGKICVLRLWNNNGLDALNEDIKDILSRNFPQPWTESRMSLRLAERVYLEPGDKFDWPDLTAETENSPSFCYGLRDQLGVLADGTVVPCCLDHEGDIALGNIFTQNMEDILSSPRATALYEGFSHHAAVEKLCKSCGYALRFM